MSGSAPRLMTLGFAASALWLSTVSCSPRATTLSAPPSYAELVEALMPLPESNLKNKSYDATVTYIHGPEEHKDLFSGHVRLMRTGEAFSGDSTMAYHPLGDAMTSLTPRDIFTHIKKLGEADSRLHNIMLRFHGLARVDTVNDKCIVEEQYLKNDTLQRTKNHFYSGHVNLPVGLALQKFVQQDSTDRFNVIYTPCHGMSALKTFGYYPSGTRILVESDADTLTIDNQTPFVTAFQQNRSWKPIDPEYFLETRLFMQNSMTYQPIDYWNKHQHIVFSTDKTRDIAKPFLIDGDTIDFGPHVTRVLALDEKSATLFQDFPREEIEEVAEHYREFFLSMAKIHHYQDSAAMALSPQYDPHHRHAFDENLLEVTLAKLDQLASPADFRRVLNDPEQHAAQVLALGLYTHHPEKLPTDEQYYRAHMIRPLDTKAFLNKNPRP